MSLNTFRYIGTGKTGCVFLMDIGGLKALKIQLLTKDNLNDIEKENLIQNRITSELVNVPRIYKSINTELWRFAFNIAKTDKSSYLSIAKELRKCNILSKVDEKQFINVTFMDYVHGGTLKEYAIENKFKNYQIRNFMYQMFWTMNHLQQTYGFRHLDLHMDNIIVDNSVISDDKEYVSIVYEDFKTALILGNRLDDVQNEASEEAIKSKAEVDKMLWVVDLGLSEIPYTSKERVGDLGNYAIEAPEVYFVDIPLMKLNCLNKPRKAYHSDMWSLGVMLVSLITASVDLPDEIKSNFPSEQIGELKDKVIDESLFRRLIISQFFALPIYINQESLGGSDIFRELFNDKFEDEDYASICTRFLLGICLFNKYIGNGLLPTSSDGIEYVENDVYTLLSDNKEILESIGMVTQEKHFFEYVIEWIDQFFYGNSGKIMLKQLFSWNIETRMNINNEDPSNTLLRGLLKNDIFKEYEENLEYIKTNNIKMESKTYENMANLIKKEDTSVPEMDFFCLDLLKKKEEPDEDEVTLDLTGLTGYENIDTSDLEGYTQNIESVMEDDYDKFKQLIENIASESQQRKILLVHRTCTHCGKESPSYVCKCISAAYCDRNCQLNDRTRHKAYCDKRINN